MDKSISLRIPDGLDALIRQHGGETAPILTDDMRRCYVTSILAAVVESLGEPLIAAALVRLNGGYVVRYNRMN